jgi:serine/threonine-protein kinase RsbW
VNDCSGGTAWAEGRASGGAGGGSAWLRVPARPAYLALIGMAVRWFGRQAALSEEKCQDLEVAVDEACSNVIRHGFAGRDDGEMTVICSPVASGLRVTILDHGKPFDPEAGLRTAEQKRSRDPVSGGLGLLLIRQLTDGVFSERDDREGNRLTLVKYK